MGGRVNGTPDSVTAGADCNCTAPPINEGGRVNRTPNDVMLPGTCACTAPAINVGDMEARAPDSVISADDDCSAPAGKLGGLESRAPDSVAVVAGPASTLEANTMVAVPPAVAAGIAVPNSACMNAFPASVVFVISSEVNTCPVSRNVSHTCRGR